MKYEAALFDMDGVILDSEPLHVVAFQATLKNHGYLLSEQDYKEHFAGKTDQAGFESYFNFVNKDLDIPIIMDEKAKKYLELAGDQLVPYPGIVPLIRNLAESMPLALVTGSLRSEAEVALKAFEIIDCFKIIVAAEDILQSKPNPEGYNQAAAALAISAENCVVVEDSPNGVKAARAAGADCIAVTNTHAPAELEDATKVVSQLELNMF